MFEKKYVKELKALRKEYDRLYEEWTKLLIKEISPATKLLYDGEADDIKRQNKGYYEAIIAISNRMGGIIASNQTIFKNLKVRIVHQSDDGVSSIIFYDKFGIEYSLMLLDEELMSNGSELDLMGVYKEEFYGYTYNFDPARIHDVIRLSAFGSFDLIESKGRAVNIKLRFNKGEKAEKYYLALVASGNHVVWKHNITKFVPKDLVE
jgi:hypothetical protein|nr:MAG TPA: hypothetical protein [Caudoviricetes sp.]